MDLEVWYRKYGDLVYSRCYTLLRNEADAAEMTQEVFLRVWRTRQNFRGEASPATYLYRVATTTCLNRLRTYRRRPEESHPDPTPPRHAPTDSVLDNLQLRQMLDLVLAEEDEGTVQCLTYLYVDGMTIEEVAELLGLSASGVRKRVSLFRARLDRAKSDPTSVLAISLAEEP